MQIQTVPPSRQPTLPPDWSVSAPLIALTLVPMLGGIARLLVLGSSPTAENARFVNDPLPVVIHVMSATLFCLLGAFQFAPSFRRRRPQWHRVAGRILMVAGLASALSGLWMTHFYAIPTALQGDMLRIVRYLVGVGMTVSLGLSWAMIMQRNVTGHRAWMIRGYALGQGAGTQVVIMLPLTIVLGELTGFLRDVLMSVAWLLNWAVAEWIIRRRSQYTVK
jgi:uncharacterized membrane protein